MKSLLKRLVNRCGYDLSRLSSAKGPRDPFLDMARLCGHVTDPVIFDIGAHHGQTARAFRNWFPRAHIFCFEPSPDSFKKLINNTSADPRIRCFNYGLTDREGDFPFRRNQQSSTNSLLETDPASIFVWGADILTTNEVIELQFLPLDSVARILSVERIHILKMDVQGAEYKIIQGAGRLCAESRIDLVYSEIIAQPTYLGQKRFDQALSSYYESGFDLFGIYNLSHTSVGKLRQVDVLFQSGQYPQGGYSKPVHSVADLRTY